MELMKEHRERERLIRSEYEEILESKSVEKVSSMFSNRLNYWLLFIIHFINYNSFYNA